MYTPIDDVDLDIHLNFDSKFIQFLEKYVGRPSSYAYRRRQVVQTSYSYVDELAVILSLGISIDVASSKGFLCRKMTYFCSHNFKIKHWKLNFSYLV